MKKKISLITGSGVLGAYLAKELIQNNHRSSLLFKSFSGCQMHFKA